jgi:hypothetical protein
MVGHNLSERTGGALRRAMSRRVRSVAEFRLQGGQSRRVGPVAGPFANSFRLASGREIFTTPRPAPSPRCPLVVREEKSVIVLVAAFVVCVAVVVLASRAARRFGWLLAPTEGLRDVWEGWLYGSGRVRRTPGSVLSQLCRQARRENLALTSDRRYAPSGIEFDLNPADHDLLVPLGTPGVDAVVAAAAAGAREGSWKGTVPGAPWVAFHADETVLRGRPRLTGIYDGSSGPSAVVSPPPSGVHDGLTVTHRGAGERRPEETTHLLHARGQVPVELTLDGAPCIQLTEAAPVATFGRSAVNDVRLDVPGVSRVHARFSVEGGHVLVADLGSTNGVLLNGTRINGVHPLSGGDVVTLGRDGPAVAVRPSRPVGSVGRAP